MADVVPDPYGTDIAFTPTGDVVVWANGAVGTLTGPANCVQALQLRMRTLPGELTLHPDYGSTLPSKVGSKYAPEVLQGEATRELGRLVEQDDRFLTGEAATVSGVAGNDEAVKIAAGLILSGGERITVSDLTAPDFTSSDAVVLDDISVSDLTEPDFDEAVAIDDPDLADQDLIDAVDGSEFIPLDDDEADALRDAQVLDDLVFNTEQPIEGDDN